MWIVLLALAGLTACDDRVPRPLDGEGIAVRIHEGAIDGDFSNVRGFDGRMSAGWASLGPGRLAIELWADQASGPQYAVHLLQIGVPGRRGPAWLLPSYRTSVNVGSVPWDASPGLPPDGGTAPPSASGSVLVSGARLPSERSWNWEWPERAELAVDEGPSPETLRISWEIFLRDGRTTRGHVVVDRPPGQYLVGWPAP